MATPHRRFSSAEDEIIRKVCAREMSLVQARRLLHTTCGSIKRRAAELGLSMPQYFRDVSRMGRPDGIGVKKEKRKPTYSAFEDHALLGAPPISVGSDPYLARLRMVHGSEQVPPWHFRSRKCREGDGYIAWCARTPDLGEGPLDVDFSEEVHFEFGTTAEQALVRLRKEVLN